MIPAMYSDYEKLIHATLIAFWVVVLTTAGATSGPFEDANAAYGTSDYWVRIRQSFPNGVPDAEHRFMTEAQYRLGMHYYFGKGVPQNYEEATKWFRLAADQGLDRAQFELGTLTRMVEAYRRVTSMRKNGFASRLGRVSISRRLRWGLYIPQGEVYRKTMMRPQNGIAARLTKASQEQNLLSEPCTTLATTYPRTISKRRNGIVVPLTKGSKALSTILAACTT
jgi:TPR repeat protein